MVCGARICSPTACAYVPLVFWAWKVHGKVSQFISDNHSGEREGEEGGDGLRVPHWRETPLEINHIRPNMCGSFFNLECPTFADLCLKFEPHLSVICDLVLAFYQLNLQKKTCLRVPAVRLRCILLLNSLSLEMFVLLPLKWWISLCLSVEYHFKMMNVERSPRALIVRGWRWMLTFSNDYWKCYILQISW